MDYPRAASDAQTFWDDVHRRRDRDRPGAPHVHLEDRLAAVPPGRALELGCGDGADAIWLAKRGWQVMAVDISPVILEFGAEQAKRAGVAEQIDWQPADLAEWSPDGSYDLVCSFFLHTPEGLDRVDAFSRAAVRLRPGGTLLLVGHLTLAPWAWDPDDTSGLQGAKALAGALSLDPATWRTLLAEDRSRTVHHSDGRRAEVVDAVLHVERLATDR